MALAKKGCYGDASYQADRSMENDKVNSVNLQSNTDSSKVRASNKTQDVYFDQRYNFDIWSNIHHFMLFACLLTKLR